MGLREKYESLGYEVGVEVPAAGKDFNECLLITKNNNPFVTEGKENTEQVENIMYHKGRGR